MKILIVTPYLAPAYGGPSKSVRELVKAIGSIGLSVDIITTNANNYGKLNVLLNTWITEESYRVRYFSCNHHNDFIISLPLINWLFHHVGNYEIVHTNTIFAPLILLTQWICKLRKVPYIITPHGMLEPWALAYKSRKKKLYFHLLEKPALQNASALQMLASTEAERIKILNLKAPLVIVPNGIDKQNFESLPNAEIFYQQFPKTQNKTLIIFLGRIDPKKGLDLLAPAFAKAHQQFPDTHLVIAGPDNIGFLPTAESYFSQAGCGDAVTFTGMLTGNLKYAALAAANIYVAPSYSEGFSMSVLEGMASGLPCIITTGCNFPEAARAASIVDVNTDQIANTLIELLKNPVQAREMGDRARQLILEQYTWDKIAAKMIEIYQTILNGQDLGYCL